MTELLAQVRGLVIDARGYPSGLAMEVLSRLAREPMKLPALLVPLVTGPDGVRQFKDIAANTFRPHEVPLDCPVVFVTDPHGTQSYAESLLSVAEAYGIGTRVGQSTAGINGMIAVLDLPSGHRVRWTGVKTLRAGGQPLFRVGVPPQVPAERTAEGVAQGRDELLDAARAVLAEQCAAERQPSLSKRG